MILSVVTNLTMLLLCTRLLVSIFHSTHDPIEFPDGYYRAMHAAVLARDVFVVPS
jgi:hypothetical protein